MLLDISTENETRMNRIMMITEVSAPTSTLKPALTQIIEMDVQVIEKMLKKTSVSFAWIP